MRDEHDLDRKLLVAVERLGRALRAARQSTATRLGLSVLGLDVVAALADGRTRRVGDLADELAVSQPTVSDALDVLARRGLIVRHRDLTDLRARLVSLTAEGESLATEIVADLRPALRAGSGSTSERGTALRVLLGEVARLQRAGIITVDRSCLTCAHYQPPRGRTRARCLLLRTALFDHDLRVDCPEHEPTPD